MTATAQIKIPGSDTIATVLLILTCILTASSVSSTILRCLARASQRRFSFSTDDWFILITTALLIVRTGLQIHGVQLYTDLLRSSTSSTISAARPAVEQLLEEDYIIDILLFPTTCLLKCTCCLFLLRSPQKCSRRVVVWSMRMIMAGLIITNLEPTIVYLAECSPVKANWIPDIGTCWPDQVRKASLYLQLVYAILFDIVFTLIPLRVVYASELQIREKILMCALAGMGGLATASAIAEVSIMPRVLPNQPCEAFKAAIFANIELHVGMVAINAACGYHIYSAPRHGRRLSDTNKTGDELARLDGDQISTHSEIEYQPEFDDASSETRITPNLGQNTYNNNSSNLTRDHNNGSTVAGHDDDLRTRTRNSPVFPSSLSLLRSLSKRKNLPPPTLLPYPSSSSSSSNPYRLRTYSHPDNADMDETDRNTLDEIIAYDVTDTIPLQDSIRKVTEYVVVSKRVTQTSVVRPPGNGTWVTGGRVP